MRNLYKLLNVDPSASTDQIRRSLVSLSEADRELCKSILLDPAKRAAYDHAYWSMIRVAWIRQSLNATFTSGWPRTHLAEWHELNVAGSAERSGVQSTRESGPGTPANSEPQKNDVSDVTYRNIVLGMVLSALIVLSMCQIESRNQTEYDGGSNGLGQPLLDGQGHPEAEVPTFNEPEMPMPEHGEVFIDRGTGEHRFVFEGIPTNLLIKVVEVDTKRVVRSVFARAGEDLEVEVPRGRFEVFLKTGQKWYGDQHQFGPFSYCSKLDNEYQMLSSNGVVDVWTIRLKRQQGGNLTQSSVSSAEFDALN